MTEALRPLELWAGAECTVNRVGDAYFDQLVATGHADRLDDIELLAGLGVRSVRFPVLWERVAPRGLASADWSWSDRRIARLLELGIEPIVGLVHHGSGPAHTSLSDPGFASGLAAFARAVAERYPAVRRFTPVNEPLTTARFSALYGHWYPHARDTGAFVRALLTEVQATAAAMAAIRQVIPHAELVQTEDLGRTEGTPELAYQWRYEQERRWLSLDLLTGRVDREHPLHRHLLEYGIGPDELVRLVDEPTPPAIIGINYYVTSDRYLDHRVHRYPRPTWGGNGRDRYVDAEAVRVRESGIAGHRSLLIEVWQRYGIAVALTEVHLGCTREEQLRWLWEAWRGAEAARSRGVDVRAVTLWSVFGAFDWDSLVTVQRGHYESGVYDLRAPEPRPTALVWLARALARGETPAHPVLTGPPWWRSGRRLGLRPVRPIHRRHGRPIAIIGDGRLARAFETSCRARSLTAVRAGPAQASALAEQTDSWAVVLAMEPRADGRGPAPIDLRCFRRNRPELAVFSSALVFGSAEGGPFGEDDPVGPVEDRGERMVSLERASCDEFDPLIIRHGTLLDPAADDDLVRRAVAELRRASDVCLSPGVTTVSLIRHLVDAVLDLIIDGERGFMHLVHLELASLLDIVAHVAVRNRVPTTTLRPTSSGPSPLRLPPLRSTRCRIMSGLHRALAEYGELVA